MVLEHININYVCLDPRIPAMVSLHMDPLDYDSTEATKVFTALLIGVADILYATGFFAVRTKLT